MNYKKFSLLKILFLLIALGLAVFLLFVGQGKDATPDHSLVFVLDVNRTMNTEDVALEGKYISRLDAAKNIIQQIIFSEPGFSYGLIIFNAHIDYIVPPTFDTGTFLLYLSGITTNLLPQEQKDFSVLSSLPTEPLVSSYIILSDFDTLLFKNTSLPKSTSLIGLGSANGDFVRYSNGVRYYDNGTSVSSARNDSVAEQFDFPYTVVKSLDNFSPQKNIFGGVHLPLSQQLFLYVLLGVFIILALFI